MTDLSPTQTPATGIYLYCLARPECLAASGALAAAPWSGVDESYPVEVLQDRAVVAVIGEVVIDEFSEENLQTLAWIGERAMRHEAVVAGIMEVSPVLPVKFGTIYRSRESLKDFLERHHEKIESGLDQLRDRSEWSVKGYLVEEDARHVIAAEDPEIQARRAAMSSSPGVRYLQQKQLDSKIEAVFEAAVARINQDLQQALAVHALDASALRLHASSVTGRAQRMVFNGSYLLSADMLPDFRDALADQQKAYKVTGLSLELRGPWPPYNFCPDLTEAPA
jgi:hypothetical protein